MQTRPARGRREKSVHKVAQFAVVLGVTAVAGLHSMYPQYLIAAGRAVQYAGVNIAGAEFAENRLPGTHIQDYSYPESTTIAYFAKKGMNIIRVPVRWERLQHQLEGELDPDEMQRLDTVIGTADSKGMRVIVDVHNYATYYGSTIGTQKVPTRALGDLWGKIAGRYKDNKEVIFGLMNEPTALQTETWLEAANIAIAKIRQAGAKNLVFVPGNGWSSARSWVHGNYGAPNGRVMLNVADPENNFSYEVHQYFNSDFTGTAADCQNLEIGVTTLTPFTQWARRHRKRGFLGEFGAGADKTCLHALDRVLRFMAENSDVWLGWTYWAAGTRWSDDYFTDIEPRDGKDRPQLMVLEKHLKSAEMPRDR